MPQSFDPFTDRTSRDIRNSLSTALVAQLTGRGGPSVEEVGRQWQSRTDQKAHLDYISRCFDVYAGVVDRIAAEEVAGARRQAVILWNAGLFFEVHEIIETIWLEVEADERLALKGFIQAAGAYVHSLRGKPEPAERLARKAARNITASSEHLGFIANLDQLLAHLEHPATPPPRLQLKPI